MVYFVEIVKEAEMKVELDRNELLEIYKALGDKVDVLNISGYHNEANELWTLAILIYQYNREAKYMDYVEGETDLENYVE